MKLKFSRLQRLLSRKAYRNIYQSGHKHMGGKIIARYRLAMAINPKLGITIGRKWGKAHERNRFKRVVREAYRKCYPILPKNLEIDIHPRSSYRQLTPKELEDELKYLTKKICDKTQLESTKSGSHH